MIKNILLAEDDRGTALVVSKQLESKGYRVFTAANGIEALKLLGGNPIDLLITDVVMPKMDGVDLYAAVKKNPATEKLPIIIVTDKQIFRESFSALGVSSFVEKTTDISQLVERITNIEKSSQETQPYRKIILSSNHTVVVDQMNNALQGMKYLIAVARSSDEILSKSLIMVPHVLVLDVLFQDKASAHEIILALRSFGALKNTKIITYAYFPENLGIDVDAVHTVEIAMKLCSDAGANEYIGRFNQGFLLERLAVWL